MKLSETFLEPSLSREAAPTLAKVQWKQTDWGLMLSNSDSKDPETPQFIMDHYLLRMHNCYNLLPSARVFSDRNLGLSKEAFSCLAVLCLQQRNIWKLWGSCAGPDLPHSSGGCALWAHMQQLQSSHQHCLSAVHTLLTCDKPSELQLSPGQQQRRGSTFVKAVDTSGISSCRNATNTEVKSSLRMTYHKFNEVFVESEQCW